MEACHCGYLIEAVHASFADLVWASTIRSAGIHPPDWSWPESAFVVEQLQEMSPVH